MDVTFGQIPDKIYKIREIFETTEKQEKLANVCTNS